MIEMARRLEITHRTKRGRITFMYKPPKSMWRKKKKAKQYWCDIGEHHTKQKVKTVRNDWVVVSYCSRHNIKRR
jgi:hypothetical protein